MKRKGKCKSSVPPRISNMSMCRKEDMPLVLRINIRFEGPLLQATVGQIIIIVTVRH